MPCSSTFSLFIEADPYGAVHPRTTYSGVSRVPQHVGLSERAVVYAAKEAWGFPIMTGPCVATISVYLRKPKRGGAIFEEEPMLHSDNATAYADLVLGALVGTVISDTRQVVGVTVSKIWCNKHNPTPGYRILVDALLEQP